MDQFLDPQKCPFLASRGGGVGGGETEGFPDPAPDPPDPPTNGGWVTTQNRSDAGRERQEVETDPPEKGSHVSLLSELAGVPIAGSSLYPPGVQDAA